MYNSNKPFRSTVSVILKRIYNNSVFTRILPKININNIASFYRNTVVFNFLYS